MTSKMREAVKAVERALIGKPMFVEKRAGLYVSRPVMNGDVWAAWAQKHGVPNPLAADDLHVTILYSTKDVKMVPEMDYIVISTTGTYNSGRFAMLGPNEDVFTFCFDSWQLHDRNWAFLRNGAESKWPTYRPHMTLGKDVGDFEISDEALREAPLHIVLGPEVYGDLKQDDQVEAEDADPENDGDDIEIVIIVERAASDAAQKMLDDEQNVFSDPFLVGALRDIATRKMVAKPVLKRLASEDWAPAEIKALVSEKVRKTKEITLEVGPGSMSEDVKKALGSMLVSRTSDEERMVVGFASVATVKGELVTDLHGDKMTPQVLTEFSRQIVRGVRDGKFDHTGPSCNEIVQTFFLSDDIQKSLGIDLGCEPLLIEMHVPGDEDWSRVKSGDWMFSIAGELYYEDEE